jgi:hypothetical protein
MQLGGGMPAESNVRSDVMSRKRPCSARAVSAKQVERGTRAL